MTEGHDGGRDNKRKRCGKTRVSPPVSHTLDSPLVRGGQRSVPFFFPKNCPPKAGTFCVKNRRTLCSFKLQLGIIHKELLKNWQNP